MNTIKLLVASVAAGIASTAYSNSISIFDDTFSFLNGSSSVANGTYDARWGTFSGGVFTPFLGASENVNNSGYIALDPFGNEIQVSFAQTNNNVVAASTQLALAFTATLDGSSYSDSAPQVILTDASWVAPTFVFLSTPIVQFSMTANTTALRGTYSFNGGNQVLNIASSAIPEPSSFAAIAGLGILGFAASRRRRVA